MPSTSPGNGGGSRGPISSRSDARIASGRGGVWLPRLLAPRMILALRWVTADMTTAAHPDFSWPASGPVAGVLMWGFPWGASNWSAPFPTSDAVWLVLEVAESDLYDAFVGESADCGGVVRFAHANVAFAGSYADAVGYIARVRIAGGLAPVTAVPVQTVPSGYNIGAWTRPWPDSGDDVTPFDFAVGRAYPTSAVAEL